MKKIVRILKVIKRLYTIKECTITNVVRNVYFNLYRIKYTQSAFLVCGKHTDLKTDKLGLLILNNNLYVGKKEVDKTHYKSWICDRWKNCC